MRLLTPAERGNFTDFSEKFAGYQALVYKDSIFKKNCQEV
jgi:hypothetical protein